MTTDNQGQEEIPADVIREAGELARAAVIEPGGTIALAKLIHRARKEGRGLRVKLGVDPTSSQLHLGHTVVLRRLQRFQNFGHTPVLIIGGFTAQIGDPSGRDTTRPALTSEQVSENAKTFEAQVAQILDRSRMDLVNNANWLDMPLSRLAPIMGRVSVNQLLSRFKDRLSSNQPFVLLELVYPLLQGFDSVEVHADIEIGGTDQRSNLFMGRELQDMFEQPQQLVMMLPILEGTDGVRKMSKSFNNSIALEDKADDIFGKCMRIPDGLIVKFFELATMLGSAAVESEIRFLAEGGNPRDAKERLATRIVHELRGEAAASEALATWHRLHSERKAPDEMPSHLVLEPKALRALVFECGLAESRSKASQLITGGAVRLDGEKVTDDKFVVAVESAEGIVLSVGKRHFVRLVPPADSQ